jgi:hypothetical protein
MELVIIAFVSLLVSTLSISFVISYKASHPKTQSLEEGLNIELNIGTYSKNFIDTTPHEKFAINIRNNSVINGLWFKPKISDSNLAVILIHGYECTYYRQIKYLSIFLDLGFNCFVYNQRYHGDSYGRFSSFGFHESLDLQKIIEFVRKTINRDDLILGTLGSSMGGVTALLQCSKNKNIDFCISESAFASMKNQYARQLKKLHLPKILLPLINAFNQLLYGYSFKAVSVKYHIDKIQVPTMIIHGEADLLVDISEAKIIYDGLKSKKAFYSVPNASHGEAFNINKEKYQEKTTIFLKENRII